MKGSIGLLRCFSLRKHHLIDYLEVDSDILKKLQDANFVPKSNLSKSDETTSLMKDIENTIYGKTPSSCALEVGELSGGERNSKPLSGS